MDNTPITERSCGFSTDIDTASPEKIIQMLYQCDKQIFKGYQQWPNIYSFCDKYDDVINHVTSVLSDDNDSSCIVLSGCGTSGRLGFLAAQYFNRVLRHKYNQPAKFKYLLAGGDEGLFKSKELIEDDPHAGSRDFVKVTQGMSHVVYIGITCGLSAPYVAGQLEYACTHAQTFYPVLIGFNQITLARNLPIENWHKTFRGVLEEFEKMDCGAILTPIYGPEPITGSSRMKGGTTTKILLDVIFSCAFLKKYENKTDLSVMNVLKTYEIIQEMVFKDNDALTRGMEQAGKSLRSGGHVYFVTDDAAGALGLIDASECPPTYGAHIDDVRGFIKGGYDSLDNNDETIPEFIKISTDYFEQNLLHKVTEADSIFILQSCMSLDQQIKSSKATVHQIRITEPDSNFISQVEENNEIYVILDINKLTTHIDTKMARFMLPLFTEVALKWLCNTITTGAHVLKGKVYQNFMIDVRIRNNKLYHRALSIIRRFSEASTEICETSLLKVIYNTDHVTDHVRNQPNSEHVQHACDMERIVPLAIVVAKQQCSVTEAKTILDKNPSLRKALESF